MTEMVSRESRELAGRHVLAADRVLVTGASGWFGRTALDLLSSTGAPVLALASRARTIQVSGAGIECREWDLAQVTDFRPTIIIDCAFLTRDRTSEMPFDDFVAANRLLTSRLVEAARLPTVRLALTVSSGAAVHPLDALSGPLDANPYGYLKREAESLLRDAVRDTGAHAVVARAWSVSGAHVQNVDHYALSSMIKAASAGAIHVAARRPVFRRYVLADELLAIALAEGTGSSAEIESGGELVEMEDLARRVARAINPRATVTRPALDSQEADDYHSDNHQWSAASERWNLASASLETQIGITARGVLA